MNSTVFGGGEIVHTGVPHDVGERLPRDAARTTEIAKMLVISKKTVERHRANILEKFGTRDRVELTATRSAAGSASPDRRTVPLTTCAGWGPG